MIETYESALAYIHSRPRIKKEATQKRINQLLKLLGNPQKDLKVIHIVGTNGKGSVVAYLNELFQGIDFQVGEFTSPFMINFNERIRINGNSISNEDLVKLIQKIKPLVDKIDKEKPEMGPSEFELITAMMYLYFASKNVDIALVEAGIGGQSDSTNVNDNAVMTIITTIGMDHMKILGNNIKLIANDKVGMMRSKIPTIVGAIPDEVKSIIYQRGVVVNSPIYKINDNFYFKQLDKNKFNFRNDSLVISKIETSMLGNFEMEDAAVAIEAFWVFVEQHLTFKKQDVIRNIKSRIKLTNWIGRMELISNSPVTIIDGAHNVPAITQLLNSLMQLNYDTIYLVMAIFADKQYDKMVEIVQKTSNVKLTLTRFNQNGTRLSADFSDNNQYRADFIKDWKQAIIANQIESSSKNIVY